MKQKKKNKTKGGSIAGDVGVAGPVLLNGSDYWHFRNHKGVLFATMAKVYFNETG